MAIWRAARLTVMLALVLGGSVSAQARSTGALTAEFVKLLEGSKDAWNRGDLAGHLAIDADSVEFMTREGPIIGTAKTAEALARSFFRDGKPVQSLRFERVTVRPLGDRHALVVGRFVLTGGDQPEHSGWFSTIWERQPVGWRIIHDHSS